MGKPITRLNPKAESSVQKILFEEAIRLLVTVAMLLPQKIEVKRGVKPYDYRKILVICILRILQRKTYADYEIEMRTDKRICRILGFEILPGKSTIQRAMASLKMGLIREFNKNLINAWINRKLNILIDASGIRIIGRSIWYSIRARKPISRRECDKVHLATCSDTMLILNWFITEGKKNDCPFFVRLLVQFQWIGRVIADTGYLSRKNYQYVADKKGSAFIPFKKKLCCKTKKLPRMEVCVPTMETIPHVV